MSNLIQILVFTVIEAIIIFKYLKFPLSVFIFLGLILFEAGLVGFYFSPKRSPTLKADFDKITPYYDAIVDAQNNLSAALDSKKELVSKLEDFNQKLLNLENAFPNSGQEIQDLSCRNWLSASIVKFKYYSQVASRISKQQDSGDKDAALQIVQKLNTADESQKLQAQLVGLRVSALEQSFVQSIFVGFLSWLRLGATQ